MPLLTHDWTLLYTAFYWIGKHRDPKYTSQLAFKQLFTYYYQHAPLVGTSLEAQFIFKILEDLGVVYATTLIPLASSLSNRTFCDRARTPYFSSDGFMNPLVDYAAMIIPSYQRFFYRNLERCFDSVYSQAACARESLMHDRFKECIKARDDFCVICQTHGSGLSDSVVLLPNCGHIPFCTTCFLEWNKNNNTCPLCRVIV